MDAVRASFRIVQAVDRPQGRLDALAPSPGEVTIADERARAAPRPIEAAAGGSASDGAPDARRDGDGGFPGGSTDARELWAQDMRLRAEQAMEREGLPPLPSFEYSVGDDGRLYATDFPASFAPAHEQASEVARPDDDDDEAHDPGMRARDGPVDEPVEMPPVADVRARIIERAYAVPLEEEPPPVIDAVM